MRPQHFLIRVMFIFFDSGTSHGRWMVSEARNFDWRLLSISTNLLVLYREYGSLIGLALVNKMAAASPCLLSVGTTSGSILEEILEEIFGTISTKHKHLVAIYHRVNIFEVLGLPSTLTCFYYFSNFVGRSVPRPRGKVSIVHFNKEWKPGAMAGAR